MTAEHRSPAALPLPARPTNSRRSLGEITIKTAVGASHDRSRPMCGCTTVFGCKLLNQCCFTWLHSCTAGEGGRGGAFSPSRTSLKPVSLLVKSRFTRFRCAPFSCIPVQVRAHFDVILESTEAGPGAVRLRFPEC